MGGLNSGIKDETKNVYFEAAKFARDNVRKTSRALGQSSDSSFRFEKGVDAHSPEKGLARALHLIEELGCGEVTTMKADVCAVDLTLKTMTASLAKINSLLGIEVPVSEVKDILTRLNFQPTVEGDTLKVVIPGYREDVDGYPDLAEDIIRSYGYDHVQPTFLEQASVTNGGLNADQKRELRLKNILRVQGYYEACNYSFYSPKDFDLLKLPADAKERRAVKILNPISEELSVMRTFLAPSMLANAVRNIRRGNETGKEFELANVYLADELPVAKQPREEKRLVLGVWGGNYDFFDLKGAVETLGESFGVTFTFARGGASYLHPGVSAKVYFGEQEVGVIGELDPAIADGLGLEKKVYLGEIEIGKLDGALKDELSFTNLPKFSAVKRDLALIADEELTCAQIEDVLMHSSKYITKAELFDVYRGGQVPAGKRSMAFTLTFTPAADAEKGFTPEVIDGFVKKILGNLKFKLGVELR